MPTFLSEFRNAICGISDSFVRFLHSDQNVRKAPDQANKVKKISLRS